MENFFLQQKLYRRVPPKKVPLLLLSSMIGFFLSRYPKAMKSSPLLRPFCGSEFWGIFSVENIKRLCVFMFQT